MIDLPDSSTLPAAGSDKTPQLKYPGVHMGTNASGGRVYSDSASGLQDAISRSDRIGAGGGAGPAPRLSMGGSGFGTGIAQAGGRAPLVAERPRPHAAPSRLRSWNEMSGQEGTGVGPSGGTPTAAMVSRPYQFAGESGSDPSTARTPDVRQNGAASAAVPGASVAEGGPVVRRPMLQRPVAGTPSTAPEAAAGAQRALGEHRRATLQARGDAASILNPMGNAGELMRRFNSSQRGYLNKGSPQARRMAGEAILGQLGSMNAASAVGQQAESASIQAGQSGEAAANEAGARRQMEADAFNADDSYRQRALATGAETRRAELTRPTLQTDADGNLLQVSGTSAAPVTGANGSPVRMPQRSTASRDYQSEADDRMLADLLGLQKDQFGEYPEGALDVARNQLADLRGNRRGSGQGSTDVPEVGGALDGHRFLGGDPSDPASWEAE
ncbi:hypothetical protein LDO26_14530 [Luteimonas sp. BDR2-5]|uniref:hypothetical protein n=1 Tax=Proluteimonas luteida TaxID=2878685 RepID=UPI001E3B8EFD|nr:hypothetical protein [Luteimonas sp. BDR2-5]MCD9029408.1 hypothetical protein [Luteimonas sp. BDR2-5]